MFIKEAELFKGMSQDFVNELVKIMVEESYEKGTSLFQESDSPNFFYVLEEGRVIYVFKWLWANLIKS